MRMKSVCNSRTEKNKDLSELVYFMLLMKNLASVLSVHPSEIFEQTEREISEKITFFMAASVHLEN